MAREVRQTIPKAITKANLRRAEAGQKPITMNALAAQAGGGSNHHDLPGTDPREGGISAIPESGIQERDGAGLRD